MQQFDYIVIGGGSGGLASARRAAAHGARVALVEARRLGGTCVNTGCIPKKLMFNAGSIAELLAEAPAYGFGLEPPRFDWPGMKARRDAAVQRLVERYEHGLEQEGVTRVDGRAKLCRGGAPGLPEVEVNGGRLRAPHVLLATGGSPRVPTLSGAQLGITSNGFFELEAQPKRVAIVGAGYVGVELAGILRALGSDVTIVARHDAPLSHFDSLLQEEALAELMFSGAEFVANTEVERVTRMDSGQLKLSCSGGRELAGFDALLWAVGRVPSSAGLGLEALGVELDGAGHVVVDAQQNTTVPGVYALGDVTGRVPLTPVAIAAGRLLAERLFGGQPDAALDYHTIPSVVFGRPPISTVGLSEARARELHGEDVQTHVTRFTNLHYAVTKHKPKTSMKLVVQRSTGRVLGVHVIGKGADEMIQGVAIALRMGATKADFDRTVAVHPTAAEELVTMR